MAINNETQFEICKAWFSHCDLTKRPNTNGNINTVAKNIAHWVTNQLDNNESYGMFSNETIIAAAKEMGIKVGYKKYNVTETYYVTDPKHSWIRYKKHKIIETIEKMPCFNISSLSIPFRPHLHITSKNINYFHHFSDRMGNIKLLNEIFSQYKGYWGSKLFFNMTDKETGKLYNCYTHEDSVVIQSRDAMWGLINHTWDETDTYRIIGHHTDYLKMLDKVAKNTEDDFILECEEITLQKI
jgi:hypothetical protein